MKALCTIVAALAAAAALSAQAVGRMADLAVYDRSTGRELPVTWHEGRAYVVGNPGNEYQVVVRNRRGEDLLAVVSVDGVNVLTGETASAQQGGYVVGSRARLDIKGWRKSLGEVASFYFTSLGDSYAARTDRPGNVGVIGVALFRRAPRYDPEPAPFDNWGPRSERKELPKQADAAGSLARPEAQSRAAPSAPLGTGHGRREESRAYYTEFDRATREPEETIAIYYDSYRNLVAQGVIRRSYAERRDPRPFPSSFAPDPWR
ncbi:MAG TPA: hypothetical protein VFV90_04355 [Usitatibacter sp.]|nr:hypothetical protein [Usitatibacter sp.]